MKDQELVLSGVDVQDLRERFMGNAALIKLIVGKFLQDQTYDQLAQAIAQGDRKAAESACHSLKGVTGNMSLKNLFALLQEQLRLYRAGAPEQAEAMMPQITEGYETAVKHMKLWLAQQ